MERSGRAGGRARDDGLWQLHLAPDGRVTVLRHETAPRLTNSTVFTIQPGPVGTLMVGTENGFNLLDRASGAIERIFPDPVSPTGLSAGHIVSSLLDRNGRLWLGTNNAGINVMLGRNSAGRPVFRHPGALRKACRTRTRTSCCSITPAACG